MKNFLLLLFTISTCLLNAQNEGVVVYSETVDLHRRLPQDREQYKDMIPQFRTTNFELFYTENESMYSLAKEQDASDSPGSRGAMRFRMGNASRDVYKNLDENRMVDSREFMTKQFLIKGEEEEFMWKIVDGQKMILDYMCLKATYSDTADTYVAWFTPQISISNGPAEYGGLPGMIMELDVNEGERTSVAVEVRAEEIDRSILKEPKKGKEVTDEEFRQIVREKMKEMRAQRRQGAGNQIIIRQ